MTCGCDLLGAYYKMETVEHFAHISLVARMLGRERVLSRDEVLRLQSLRGRYGIASPAAICIDEAGTAGVEGEAVCQVVQAPEAPGQRLVDAPLARVRGDAEIRLTYGELAALIEDAVRTLGRG
jgi:L-fuculose-phosphate aldolase